MNVPCPKCKTPFAAPDELMRSGVARTSCPKCSFAFVIRLGAPGKTGGKTGPPVTFKDVEGVKASSKLSSTAGEIGPQKPKFIAADTRTTVVVDDDLRQAISDEVEHETTLVEELEPDLPVRSEAAADDEQAAEIGSSAPSRRDPTQPYGARDAAMQQKSPLSADTVTELDALATKPTDPETAEQDAKLTATPGAKPPLAFTPTEPDPDDAGQQPRPPARPETAAADAPPSAPPSPDAAIASAAPVQAAEAEPQQTAAAGPAAPPTADGAPQPPARPAAIELPASASVGPPSKPAAIELPASASVEQPSKPAASELPASASVERPASASAGPAAVPGIEAPAAAPPTLAAASPAPVTVSMPPSPTVGVPAAGAAPAVAAPPGSALMSTMQAQQMLAQSSLPSMDGYGLDPGSKGLRVVGVLFLAVIFLGGAFLLFLAARNDWALDFSHMDRMIAQAFRAGAENGGGRDGVQASPPSVREVQLKGQRALVAEGIVTNNGALTRRFIYVRALLQRYGTTRASAEVPAGNVLKDEELATLTPEALRDGLNPAGRDGANTKIEGGKTVAYQVVLTNVPDDYSPGRYTVEIKVTRAELYDGS